MKSFKAFFLFAIFYALIGLHPGSVFGAVGDTDGKIVRIETYVFPAYDVATKIRGFERTNSRTEYEAAVSGKDFKFEKLTYLSDGLKVKAYLYRPSEIIDKKYPAIIFNRGSYVREDIAPEVVAMFHRLAREGFIILAPMYRQSDGGEGKDSLGGEDVNDLMNTLPLAKNLEFIDTKNLFMYGESRGGMMTYQAMKRGFPMNASAVFGAFTDLDAMVRARPDVYTSELGKAIFGNDYESKTEEIFQARSAINWADKLETPLLIMHGGNDQSVAPGQSLRIAQKLSELKKVYELVIYAEDNHILLKNKLNRDKRAIRWFKKYLK